MTGYNFHPEVENDFAEIWDFIAEDSPNAADRVIADMDFRVYAPDERPLSIVAVIHARRSPRVMAAILRGRE